MGTIGAGEILVIALIALIVLGPDKLPEAARKVGQVIAEVRKVSSGFQAELRDALHEPVDGTPPPTSGSTIKRSPTPKAPPPPDPDAGTADGTAIDPSDWYGGAERSEPIEADASSTAGPEAGTEAPDGPADPEASAPSDPGPPADPAGPGDRAA
jgi:sec-independent protein translocase protein TatB